MKKIMNVSDYIIKRVVDLGIDFIPIYQSGNALRLIDAAGKNKSIKTFVPLHEQTVGLSVEAYARFKGFGVGIVGAGPAATNLSTGVFSAFCDSIPCLFLTGQVGMYHSKRGKDVRQRGFQEVDVESHMKPIAKYTKLVDKPESIRYELDKAIYLAKSGRPGPVVLDIPYDVQWAEVDINELDSYKPPSSIFTPLSEIKNEIEIVINNFSNSKKPLIIIGGGLRISNQTNNLKKLLEKLQIPTVSTWAAADILDSDNQLYLGNGGRSGNRSAIYAIQESDYILCLGTRFTTKFIIDDKKFASKAKISCVDIDNGELNDGLVKIDQKINCDLGDFINEFNKNKFTYKCNENWSNKINGLKKNNFFIDETSISESGYVSPYKFYKALYEQLRPKSIVIPDGGMNLTWTYQCAVVKNDVRIISGLGASTMGYGISASIGAYMATGHHIICFTGDGGLQMNIQELQSIAFNKLPIKIFVINNEVLGNTKFPAMKMFNRSTGNDEKGGYGYPDFCKVAEAFGIKSFLIDHEDKISLIDKILDINEPVLINVKIHPEQFMLDTPLE